MAPSVWQQTAKFKGATLKGHQDNIADWIGLMSLNLKDMAVEIITRDDLEQFRLTLLQDIKLLLTKRTEEPQKYLKSYQVKNMLKISGGTLHTLRSNGTLKFTRIGHIIYYKYEDIMQLMEGPNKKPKK